MQDQIGTTSQPTPSVLAFQSLKWTWAIRDHEDLSPSLRFVALEIGAFANERGEARPSLDRLKADTGLSHAHLKRLRGELVELGYLELVKKGDGRGKASLYRLTMPSRNRLIEPSENRLMPSIETGSLDEPLREIGREPLPAREREEPLAKDLVAHLSDEPLSDEELDPLARLLEESRASSTFYQEDKLTRSRPNGLSLGEGHVNTSVATTDTVATLSSAPEAFPWAVEEPPLPADWLPEVNGRSWAEKREADHLRLCLNNATNPPEWRVQKMRELDELLGPLAETL